MKTYIVEVREVHVQRVRIDATNESSAMNLVSRGNGAYLDGLEYSETLGRQRWIVREPLKDER